MYPLISSNQSLLSSFERSSILLFKLIKRLSLPTLGIADNGEDVKITKADEYDLFGEIIE